MSKWKRNCPNSDNNLNCKEKLYYSTKRAFKKAIKDNSLCYKCASLKNKNKIIGKKRPEHSKRMTGKNNPMYGKSVYSVWFKKYGKEEADKRQKIANERGSKSHSGKNNPMYGKTRPDLSERNKQNSGKNHPNYGKCRSEKTKKKIGLANKGNLAWNKGLTKKDDKRIIGISGENNPAKNPIVRKKLRILRIKEIEEKHGQCMPNYNSSSISIIESKAKELNITDLQHAENGGEYQVCGYFVDGYSKAKNTVIEYYEPFHERQKERDKRRKREIIDFLKCGFIEIKEQNG